MRYSHCTTGQLLAEPVTLETFYVPPSPPLQFFGRFTAYFLLAVCALGGIIAVTGSGVFSGNFDVNGNAIPSELA
jgi:hypothetical protein